ALFEIAQEPRDGLVRRAAERPLRADVAMRVPAAVPATRMTDLNETHSLLGQSAGEQQLPAKLVGRLHADAIESLHMPWLACKVDDLRRRQLHARRQLEGLGARGDVGVRGIASTKLGVQLLQRLHLAVALGGACAGRRIEIRNGCRAGLE